MVIYVTCSDPRFIIYLGKDKYENEDLIKWGFPNDIWFHVDKFSSAHVYLRLPPDITIDTIPKQVMQECLQLVKDGSKDGRKQERVSVCYTPWSNLKKTASMEIGEVGFKNDKEVHHIPNVMKDKDLLKKLMKTWVEKEVDLEKERKAYDLEEKNKKKKAMEELKKKEKEDAKRYKEELKEKRFEYIDEIGTAHTNKEDIDYEEDFM